MAEPLKIAIKSKIRLINTSAPKNCDGGDDCCGSGDYKCLEGEGDCDSDSDCATGLFCGTNNCQGPNFDSGDDCCLKG